jgi:hypothetical protein
MEFQCPKCKSGHNGRCWPEYPKATKCQDFKEDKVKKDTEVK